MLFYHSYAIASMKALNLYVVYSCACHVEGVDVEKSIQKESVKVVFRVLLVKTNFRSDADDIKTEDASVSGQEDLNDLYFLSGLSPIRGSAVRFHPLEHPHPLEYYRPDETVLHLPGSTIDLKSCYCISCLMVDGHILTKITPFGLFLAGT
ncbi:hypothetical protein RJT34_12467 [Clitoria ternatea]|uniref:Uncharacterized protein n=1 Tax=Clitoria ternatea TaxID=43366 RepID=A0AAN9JLU1_CLITE